MCIVFIALLELVSCCALLLFCALFDAQMAKTQTNKQENPFETFLIN